MALSLSNESKNTLALANESKAGASPSWDETDPNTWDDMEGTWDDTGLVLLREDKNNLTLSNESKN